MQLFAHLFFPRHTNNYRAKILHPLSLLFITFIISAAYLFRIPHRVADILGYTASKLPVSSLVELTNQKRMELGIPALSWDEDLSEAARQKGLDMLEHDYWAHVSPDGTTPWVFFNNVEYRYQYAGENLARDFDSPEEVVKAWMASPKHRDNLLSQKYQDIGMAVVEGDLNGTPTTLVVQMFGAKPKGLAALEPPDGQSVKQQNLYFNSSNRLLGNTSLSGFSIQKRIALGLVGLLLVVIALDAIIVWQARIVRISGRTSAHVAFLTIVLFVLFLTQKGTIF